MSKVFNMVGGGGGGIKLVSIKITKAPTKTTYVANEPFDSAGMVVEATYSNGAKGNVTGYTVTPSAVPADVDTVTISYSEGGVTATATQTVTHTTVSIPQQSGTLTYNAKAQSPTWSNYQSQYATVSVTPQTDAGDYTATFTLKYGTWSDGTSEPKNIKWTIGKAAGKLSVDKTSITLNSTTKSADISADSTGTVSAKSSDTTIATVSVQGSTVTVSSVNNTTGTATITISAAESKNYKKPADVTVSVDASFISRVLNDVDWDTIRSVSDAGQGANLWSVGDCKAVTLNGTVGDLSLSNFTTYAFIIGFNHNSSVEGANRIHFQLGKTARTGGKDIALCDSSYKEAVQETGYFSMNSTLTNSGGWASSQMRTNICGTSLTSYSETIIAVIPAALRAVLKSVTKYTDNTGGKSTAASAVTATTDYFFLLSEFEVFGSISRANTNEESKQAQYAYYSAGNSIIKYNHSSTSSAVSWWLRSPRASNSISFVIVYIYGTVDDNPACNVYGFAPGFCV